ncbi:uncharacterized protein LOC114935831 [Nylanderia fulva]|uniref:uncharacterized protein LOC114935831 n=1 Tax=Nylanderia fulva TaxID=613905 RepID=UPI0010FAE27D|nr:uncharacterized protein LOC114935831 [Nylanderia fulva]
MMRQVAGTSMRFSWFWRRHHMVKSTTCGASSPRQVRDRLDRWQPHDVPVVWRASMMSAVVFFALQFGLGEDRRWPTNFLLLPEPPHQAGDVLLDLAMAPEDLPCVGPGE